MCFCVSRWLAKSVPGSNSRPSTNVLPAGDLFPVSAVCLPQLFLPGMRTAQVKGSEADVADAQLFGGYVLCQSCSDAVCSVGAEAY